MNIFFPKKEHIECDPYKPQLINNYVVFNTGYVKINDIVLNDFIEQSSTRNITVQSKFHNDKQRDDLKSRILNLS